MQLRNEQKIRGGFVGIFGTKRRSAATLRSHKVAFQRTGMAFFLLLFVFSTATPSVEALIATHQLHVADTAETKALEDAASKGKAHTQTNLPKQAAMKENYAGPLPTSDNAALTARDFKPQSVASNLPGVLRNSASVTQNEALQGGITQKKAIEVGEIVSERTATTSTSRNADGSYTTRQYSQPKFFKKAGSWQPIDTTLIEDKNAGDSTNVLGKIWGQVESVFTNEKTYTVADNDWQARFAPSNAGQGMVRIKQGESQIGYVPVDAASVSPEVTTENNVQTVHYYNLWQDVDVEYVVSSTGVKENIILKSKDATPKVAFKVIGAQLKNTGANNGTQFSITGALNDKFAILAPNLILNNFGLETDTSKYVQSYQDGTLSISVNKNYLDNLPQKAFPAVIDPTTVTQSYIGDRSGGNYLSYKSDGFICYSNQCNVYAGSLLDSNSIWRSWRGEFFAAYDFLKGKQLTNARLHLTKRDASFYTGTTDPETFTAYSSNCHAYDCLGASYGSVTLSTSGDINLTSLYQNAVNAGNWQQWVMLKGIETNATTFKNFDPDHASTYVEFTYNDILPTPTITAPANNQVLIDPQVAIASTSVTNPSTGAALQYSYCVSTGPSCDGAVVVSSPQSLDPKWTVPDGVLQDGTSYYVQARSYDPSTQVYSNYGPSVPFKLDSRSGSDSTQAADRIGPISVDLATGNVNTSVSSHASKALGGDLGVSLSYNSPLRSRSGLVAQYFNNTNWSGATIVTRVDQNVDFTWGAGSSVTGTVQADNFSAIWSGYFIAPTTGSYYFGALNDDNMTINVNGQDLYTNTYCPTGPCYGSSVNLTAGQVVPLSIKYIEVGGNATARVYVKGAVNQQIIPSRWLQTGVRSTAQQYGLVGHYYNDTGDHSFTNSANTMFMQRTDSLVSFNWGYGSPAPGGPADNFMTRWTGYITAPTTGTYYFGTQSDDGSRITIGSNQVFNKWADDPNTEQYGSAITLNAGQAVPITVDYFEHGGSAAMALKVQGAVSQQVVPSTWLTPQADVLPAGWHMSAEANGDSSYNQIKITQGSAVLTDASGETHEYKATNGSYAPPAGETGSLVRNNDGTFTFQDADGRTYVFNVDGSIQSISSPADDLHPAALQYIYGGTPAKLTQITDSLNNNRWAKLYYSGDVKCGTAPSGYDAQAPSGMLCAVETNDGRTTYFFYKSGNLARVQLPGNDITDYGYDTLGRVTSVRGALANDAIAAGVQTNDNTATTELTYDSIGRLSTVTAPAPQAGAARIQQSIAYFVGNASTNYFGATEEHIVGKPEPVGYTRRIEFDSLFRTVKDFDATGLATTTEWELTKDLVMSTTDATGLKSTTIYDDEDRAVSSYGPAPAADFNTWNWKLTAGQTLTHGQSIKSSDNRFTFMYQDDGNVVLYGPTGALWASNTGGQTATALTMQGDGNLVLYNGSTAIWSSATNGGDGSSYLAVLNDGSAKIFNGNGSQVGWSTNSTFGIGNPSLTSGYNKPLSAYANQVAHTDTAYDQSMQGPSVAYYTYNGTSKVLTGAPKMHSTNLAGATSGDFTKYYTSSPVTGVSSNWGFHATSMMRLPVTGRYSFRLWSDNGVRLYIDDQLMLDDWNDGVQRSHPQITFDNVAGTVHRFRIDYYHTTGDANIGLYLTPPGGSETSVGINQYFSPNYSLATSNTMYDSSLGNTVTTANFGTNPELGLAQSTTVDANGLNLTGSATYEAAGATNSYLRQTSKTSAGGSTISYSYYTPSDTVDNPCTTDVDLKYQAGMLHIKTDPDPDGAGPQTAITTEYVYDNAGRVVATRKNSDPWTCTTYDARSRQSVVTIPAFNGEAGRTVSYDYSVGGNPLETTMWDGNGWVVKWTDLLGRVVRYRDVHDDETTTAYDNFGRVTNRTSPIGTESFAYDDYGRLTTQQLDGAIYATMSYDAYSRVSQITYPAAGQMKVAPGFDSFGRVSTLAYTMGDGTTTVSDTATFSQSSRVQSELVQSGASQLSSTFGYDNAGRLTSANIGPHTYAYSFGAQDASCGAGNNMNLNAGKNGNRTSQTIDGVSTKFCYNYADQLVSSSDPTANYTEYDSHGNMTYLGTGTTPLRIGYDSSDRNSCLVSYDSNGNGAGMYYTRDLTGRIIYREHDTISNHTWNMDAQSYYGYTGDGDTADFIRNDNWDIVEKTLHLPGGVLVTIRPQQTGNSQKQYSLPNILARTLLTTDAAGANTSTGNGPLNTFVYDPFGNMVQGSVLPANTLNGSYGYGGPFERLTETSFGLMPIQMGARVYLPTIGRFTSTDPVPGGTANPYVYMLDPINSADYSGQWGFRSAFNWVKKHIVAVVVAVIVIVAVAVAVFFPEAIPVIAAAAQRAVSAVQSFAQRAAPTIGKTSSAIKTAANDAEEVAKPMPRASADRINSFMGSRAAPIFSRSDADAFKNSRTVINGVSYSGHALNEMQNSGIYNFAVNNALNVGSRTIDPKTGAAVFYDVENDLTVIQNLTTGRVITAYYGGN